MLTLGVGGNPLDNGADDEEDDKSWLSFRRFGACGEEEDSWKKNQQIVMDVNNI